MVIIQGSTLVPKRRIPLVPISRDSRPSRINTTVVHSLHLCTCPLPLKRVCDRETALMLLETRISPK